MCNLMQAVPASSSNHLHIQPCCSFGLQDESSQGAEEANTSAATELERVFNQADFLQMQVVGQFNLGFIIARLGQDLFIIDQHASDEKYNFERLAATTVLNRQPLLHPQVLDLSPGEVEIVRENLSVFTQNGFDIREQGNGQLCLAAVPFSRNVTFSKDDVLELVGLLSKHGGGGSSSSQGVFSFGDSTPSGLPLQRPSR